MLSISHVHALTSLAVIPLLTGLLFTSKSWTLLNLHVSREYSRSALSQPPPRAINQCNFKGREGTRLILA